MYDVNIVIVNYKMKDDIEKCLDSFYKEIKDGNLAVNVVIVDNNSKDGIDKFIEQKYLEIKLVRQSTNAGFGKSQNVGIKSVDAKYHFALNPDTDFSSCKNMILKMYDFMEKHKRIGMIGPKIVYPDGSLQYSCWRFPKNIQPLYQRTKLGKTKRGKKKVDYHHMKDFDHNKTLPVDAIMGSAMFVRGEAIKEVGMFDERYWMYYEDIDWCHRMWDYGWPVYYVHDIVLKHSHGRGSAKVPGIINALIKNKLARIHLKSWLQYVWKWRSKYKYYAKLS
ncbi:TPA: hypothetical protein DEP86_03895 [Candidatus Uhrbacteria bacterium]|nr:hypothetical protein [Candidatus Uhrbacteria bacterium]